MHRNRKWAIAAALGTGALALSGCAAGSGAVIAGGSPAAVRSNSVSRVSVPPPTSAAPKPAVISARPAANAKNTDPARPARITVSNGTVASVRMISSSGAHIPGKLSADGSTWTSTEQLGYGRTYTITAVAKNDDGTAVTKKTRFSTLTPDRQTTPSLNTLDDYYAIEKGATYGVAMVPDIEFTTDIANKQAVDDAIKIRTSPHVDGAFYWTHSASGDEVHWRPKKYWKPGTAVTIAADLYGVKLGPGLYGGDDVRTSFKIGPKDLTVAHDTATNEGNPDTADHVYVYHSGKLVRTMLTSMGKHGGYQVPGGGYINFYTLDGNYTVLDHENPALMSSQSYGLPPDSPDGYGTLSVPYSTKISSDGIYLHEYNQTISDQQNGNDVSEGCLNLKTSDAKWFFNQSRVGDPVQVRGAKGAPTIQVWEGGDWSVPWSTWIKGGNLH